MELVDKIAKTYHIRTCYLLCKKPARYISATRTQVTEKIFNSLTVLFHLGKSSLFTEIFFLPNEYEEVIKSTEQSLHLSK